MYVRKSAIINKVFFPSRNYVGNGNVHVKEWSSACGMFLKTFADMAIRPHLTLPSDTSCQSAKVVVLNILHLSTSVMRGALMG